MLLSVLTPCLYKCKKYIYRQILRITGKRTVKFERTETNCEINMETENKKKPQCSFNLRSGVFGDDKG